jgi:hypothetical protein
MPDVNIRGLDSLINAIEHLKDPFRSSEERDRHRELLKIQEKQTEILGKQKEINEKQSTVSRALTLATIVLALAAFLQTILAVMQLPSEFYQKLFDVAGFWGALLAIFGIFSFVVIMAIIVYLLILFFSKKKI